jgi:hypothetical protein
MRVVAAGPEALPPSSLSKAGLHVLSNSRRSDETEDEET